MVSRDEVQAFDLTGNRYLFFGVFILLLLIGIYFEKNDQAIIPIHTRRWEMYGLSGKQALDMYSVASFCLAIFPLAVLLFPRTFGRKILFEKNNVVMIGPLLAGRKIQSAKLEDIIKIRFFRQSILGRNSWWSAALERSIGFSTADEEYIFPKFYFQNNKSFYEFQRELSRRCPSAIVTDE